MKEVHNLKKNVLELKEEITKLKSDSKIICERNTDVDDRLTIERNLTKRVEKDPMKLQEEHSEPDSSSSFSDDFSNVDEIQSKAKGKSSKHSQGQGGESNKKTSSKKTHRDHSNLSSGDECVFEVDKKSNPNKKSCSGKHQKEELRQGNTVPPVSRKTQRSQTEAEKDAKKKDPMVKRQLVEQANRSCVEQKSRPIPGNEQRSRSPYKKQWNTWKCTMGKKMKTTVSMVGM